MIKDFFSGMAFCLSSLGYLNRYGLLWSFVVPFFAWLTVTAVMLWSGMELANFIYEGIKKIAKHYDAWPEVFSSGGFLIKLFIKITVWYVFWMYSRYVALAVLGPFLSWLSEKVEKNYLTENNLQLNLVKISFFYSFIRGISISLKYAFWETLWVILLSLMGMAWPFFGFIAFFFVLLVSWYFSGASVMDFVLERHSMDIKQTEHFIKKNRYVVIGLGMFYWASFSVPYISLFTGLIFGTIMSVTGATVAFHKLKNNRFS